MSYAGKVIDALTELLPDCEPELVRLYALVALTWGPSTSCEDVHDAWAIYTTAIRPDHPCLVPYDELTREQQDLDLPYRDAIAKASTRLGL